MRFTNGHDLAFEMLMQQTPGFDRYTSPDAANDNGCGKCRFYRPRWKYQFCIYSECPYEPGKQTTKNERKELMKHGSFPSREK